MNDHHHDPLARLRADRLTTLQSEELQGRTFQPVLRQNRRVVARAFGRRAAADLLSWDQVTTFRGFLADAQSPGGAWSPGWGPRLIECVAGRELAAAAPVVCWETHISFLLGIEDAAQAIEAAG